MQPLAIGCSRIYRERRQLPGADGAAESHKLGTRFVASAHAPHSRSQTRSATNSNPEGLNGRETFVATKRLKLQPGCGTVARLWVTSTNLVSLEHRLLACPRAVRALRA